MVQLHLFFSFLCRHYLVDSLSFTNYYSLYYVKFRETFDRLIQHSTLFFSNDESDFALGLVLET